MRTSQIRAFHAVAVHGGFSKAAAAMHLTQPAVSDHVRKLEQEYDVLLFSRHKKQVSLTQHGRQLLDIIRPMFEIESRAAEFLSESRAITSGHLRIIADNAYHVTGVLSQFRQRYPDVHLTLSSGNSADVIAKLARYEADIGVLGSAAQNDNLQSIALGVTPIIAFAATTFATDLKSPAGLAELAKRPLVLREKGSKTRQKLEDAAKSAGVKLTPTIEAEGREAVRELVASGAGIGFVSEAEYGRDDRLRKIPIKNTNIQMEETVVCIDARREVRIIRAFMAMAESTAQAKP